MATIDISARIIGDKELAAALARLSSRDIPKAIKAGVRDAARAGTTTMAKSIGQHYTLKAARIKQDVSKPQYREGGLSAVIKTRRRPITLKNYGARLVKSGLSVSIVKGERFVAQRAFLRVGGSNQELLPFRRRGAARIPLDVLHGPSIHGIYAGGRHKDAIQQATEHRIVEALEKGIIRAIGAMGRGYGR